MDIPAPYDYNTETFNQEAAFNHILQYPAFANALANHQEELYNYLGMSTIIIDLMKNSFEARRRYQNQKTSYERRGKAARQVAKYAALLSLVILTASFLTPLAASQTLIWALLAIGACLLIILPMSLTISLGRKAHDGLASVKWRVFPVN